MSAPLPGDALAALARKYGALVALRERRDRGEPAPTRATLRALAAEFPGCLRELDTLGGVELGRRARACADAAAGAAQEPWMPWIAGYHALMRAALALRAGGAGGTDAGGIAVDDAFVKAVREPPDGRVSVVVLRVLAAHFDTPAATLAAALFPVRRPSPYRL